MTSVSIIISNFNGAKYLPRLIDSLHRQEGIDAEIIVVDRNSSDESDFILAQHSDIKVIKHPPETGLVSGYAAGADKASHDLLYFCNEDMWYEPDCLRRLCGCIDLPKRVGAVMPVQWSYDGGSLVNPGAWFEKSIWTPSNPFPFRVSNAILVEHAVILSGINAGACLFHRSSYEEIDGWDRDFFLDFEDTDISIRLWQRDWQCMVEPLAKVYHAVGASNAQLINSRKPVSRKRYIEGSSNIFAISLKTFTGASVFLPVLIIFDRMLRNILRARFIRAWWDVLTLAHMMRRMPKLLQFRRRNLQFNLAKPGQNFFKDPKFDSSLAMKDHTFKP